MPARINGPASTTSHDSDDARSPASTGEAGIAIAFLQHVQATVTGGLTPDNVAKAIRVHRSPSLRQAVLEEIASRWGSEGARQLLEAEQRLSSSSAPDPSSPHPQAPMSSQSSAHAIGPAPHQASTPSSAHGAHGDATVADHANAAHSDAHAGGAIDSAIAPPPVSAGASPAPQQASEAAPAYLSINGNTASASEKQADDIKRIEYIYETAQQTGNGILGSLVPGYVAARDQCDPSAVAELGGRLVGAFSVAHGAKAALDQMLQTLPRHSVPGASPDNGLALATTLQAVEAKAPLLAPLLLTVDAMIATTMTPHVFQGNEVAGKAVVVSLDGPPMQRTAKLTGELQRTVGMLVLVDDLKAQLLEGKRGLDRASLQAARSRLIPWASRPLDLAFLRAVLGPIWELLDATASPIESKPSDVLADATKQAKHTGWLGDVGQVDVNNACNELRIGRRENAEFVIRQLYTADPDTRARLLIQIKERGLLDALCSAVGWADIKELHDSLGSGFSEIKTDLQHYFLTGKDGYGPDLGHEWERHDSSLHGLAARLGGAGTVLNFALDVGTFGFNSSYGKALDDRSEGQTSEGEASHDKMHAAGRTAAIAAISMLTGGLADKLVRGGAATVSTIRAVGAGAAGGSVGGVSALGASDAYGNYISGDQQRFSSPEEYVKAALLGGAIGGAVGGVTQGLSNRTAAKYVPRSSKLPTPAEAEIASDPSVSESDSAVTSLGRSQAQAGEGLGPQKFSTDAKTGLDPSPESVRQGTVRMEDHPDFAKAMADLEAKGYKIKFTKGAPCVQVWEIRTPQGDLVRVEKAVVVRPGMRYLDLEHEMGHVGQIEQLKSPIATERFLENGREYNGPDRPGLFTKGLDKITEYHNRLAEFFRLKERGIDPDVLREHAAGVRDARYEYQKWGTKNNRAKSNMKWQEENLPDLPELANRFAAEEGH